MGSRTSDGQKINQPDFRVYHQGPQVQITSLSGVNTQAPSVDHSDEYAKFVDANGSLTHQVTRGLGIHTSVSTRSVEASGTCLGHMRTKEERKVFFIDNDRNLDVANQSDWTIFDANGEAVGEPTGTTDIDITPHDT